MIFQWLIDVANRVGFHISVLLAVSDELGKGCQQSFYAQAIHFDKLPRNEGFALARADRSRENDLNNKNEINDSEENNDEIES